MEAELNQCQTETCKTTTENVEDESLDQKSVVREEAATPEKKEQEGTEENINRSEGEGARSDKQKAATTEIHEQEKTVENINRSEGEEARSGEQKEAATPKKREQERTEEKINQSEGEEAKSDEQKESATPEKHEQERTEESEVVRPSKPKTDNEGDINSEESQTSSINPENTEKHEEETACIQPAGADVVDDTKKEQQSAKSTTDSGVTECRAQAESTTKTDAKKASDKRSADPPRSTTIPKTYGRSSKKDIAEKFGGVATSGVKVKRSTSCGAGAVKNMLLEWCRAKTRGREGVDIQNFSSSWSNGLAFCALIVAFFPDAFDYDSLDPKNRRHNFQLAFTTAEERADCPPLLDIEDMVRMKVPDSKCVYTYVQELYRSLVAKGLVKTKKA